MTEGGGSSSLVDAFVVCGLVGGGGDELCSISGETGYLGPDVCYKASVVDSLSSAQERGISLPPHFAMVRGHVLQRPAVLCLCLSLCLHL